MKTYPAWLEDKPVDFVADLGREAAFQELGGKEEKKQKKEYILSKTKLVSDKIAEIIRLKLMI